MLIFIHIAKTGGISLRGMMSVLNPMIVSHQSDLKERMEMARKRKRKALLGHIPYGIHQYNPDSCEYVTILRHPAERVFSKFAYNYRKAPKKKPPLAEFMEQLCAWNVQNLAVRQLCGLGLLYHGPIHECHYDDAVRNLELVKYVGFTDNLGKLARRLRADYGLGGLGHDNKTKNHKVKNLPKKDVELVLGYNEWDMKLYDFAKKMVGEREESEGDD